MGWTGSQAEYEILCAEMVAGGRPQRSPKAAQKREGQRRCHRGSKDAQGRGLCPKTTVSYIEFRARRLREKGLPGNVRRSEGPSPPMNLPELTKLHEVRQTFGAFGCGCKETFKTLPEPDAYGRVIAGGLAGICYHRTGNYADIPYRYPRCKNPNRYAACETAGKSGKQIERYVISTFAIPVSTDLCQSSGGQFRLTFVGFPPQISPSSVVFLGCRTQANGPDKARMGNSPIVPFRRHPRPATRCLPGQTATIRHSTNPESQDSSRRGIQDTSRERQVQDFAARLLLWRSMPPKTASAPAGLVEN
jgi:hypothetical protein